MQPGSSWDNRAARSRRRVNVKCERCIETSGCIAGHEAKRAERAALDPAARDGEYDASAMHSAARVVQAGT